MAKKVVGKFNHNLTKIEFYDIVDNYKHYTILKKQGTKEHYAWDNETSMLSSDLHILVVPENKTLYKMIMERVHKWYYGDVFFWADSKFVTQYGLPNYDRLVNLYRELLEIKDTEVEILRLLIEVEENESFIDYVKCRWRCSKLLRAQRKTIKKLAKEFKLIW